jgi:thiol-disulfide isomerase/thioredoxin
MKKMTNEDKNKKEGKEEEEIKETSFSIPIVPALLGIILVLGISVGILMNKPCPNVEDCEGVTSTTTIISCPPCPQASSGENLNILYLMPLNCSNCDIPMVQKMSQDLGIKIVGYVTDSVHSPMILIGTMNRATLALANSRYNILNSICEFANYEKACTLKEETSEGEEIKACLEKYNSSPNSVVFYHAEWCGHCKKMMPWVKELEREKGYEFLWIEVDDEEGMKIAKECLSTILDTRGYVPQFACPATKKLKVGEFPSKEKMGEFVEECKKAEES